MQPIAVLLAAVNLSAACASPITDVVVGEGITEGVIWQVRAKVNAGQICFITTYPARDGSSMTCHPQDIDGALSMGSARDSDLPTVIHGIARNDVFEVRIEFRGGTATSSTIVIAALRGGSNTDRSYAIAVPGSAALLAAVALDESGSEIGRITTE